MKSSLFDNHSLTITTGHDWKSITKIDHALPSNIHKLQFPQCLKLKTQCNYPSYNMTLVFTSQLGVTGYYSLLKSALLALKVLLFSYNITPSRGVQVNIANMRFKRDKMECLKF